MEGQKLPITITNRKGHSDIQNTTEKTKDWAAQTPQKKIENMFS